MGSAVEDMYIVAGEDFAIAVNFERGIANVDGKEIVVDIRATNTFRKEDGKWKMIGHHTDHLSFLDK